MGYLRKRDNGAITEWLSPDSPEYQLLKAMRFQAQVTAQLPSTVQGLPAGETGGIIQAGQPVWEEVPEEDINFPDPPGGRVLVVATPPVAVAADETVSVPAGEQDFAGTLTDVEYVPNGAINGQVTNNRSVTLQQEQVTGTATPVRAVTALASVTFDATHSNPGPGGGAQPGPVPTALTITQAAFSSAEPVELSVLSVHNGTGLPDPGGVLYAVYTRA